ncbi:MAG TPA: hypothetical protein PKI11_03875 [Candidatus Hydrogenedentes bacterium]|nr:hypothetical protein [Candidatus Hydrogenedentota bacterium]HNT87823.1 hypothetical protein [Candidatus Hydrogenedentota bacterium]
MTPKERADALAHRRANRWPWHSPPHVNLGPGAYLISASCFEHRAIIGESPERMAIFEDALCEMLYQHARAVYAWCVLPNHYHALVETAGVEDVAWQLGRLHGRCSRFWNLEEGCVGRKTWFNCTNRAMRDDRHFWATMNYVQHNAVKHGYVDRWEEWPYSSARGFLQEVGRDEALRLWREYPILDYGKGWDEN